MFLNFTNRKYCKKQKQKNESSKFYGFVIEGKSILKNTALILAFICVFTAGVRFINTKARFVSAVPKGYLSIVIDDFGYDGEGTDEMLNLDIPLTCALMPFSSKSAQDLEKIKSSGKEFIVHMPMESLMGKKSWVGDKGVFLSMTDDEIRCVIDEAFEIADGAVGLNNHMGSAIMEDERILRIIAEEINKRQLIFLDSKTTPKSKGKVVCNSNGACFFERDVFLDSTNDINVVKKQLRLASDIALKNGVAIAIGHVGPEGGKITVQAINDMKKELEEKGIVFVTLSDLREVITYGEREPYF